LKADRRVLSPEERLEETLFTGLRLTEGLCLEAIAADYGVDVWTRYGEELQPFIEAGLLIYDGAVIRLSREGMLLANEVMAVFIS
jgi:oxygen-independent coproporphyrinogen-3 oxidase